MPGLLTVPGLFSESESRQLPLTEPPPPPTAQHLPSLGVRGLGPLPSFQMIPEGFWPPLLILCNLGTPRVGLGCKPDHYLLDHTQLHTVHTRVILRTGLCLRCWQWDLRTVSISRELLNLKSGMDALLHLPRLRASLRPLRPPLQVLGNVDLYVLGQAWIAQS